MAVPHLCIFQIPASDLYYIAYTINVYNRQETLKKLTKISNLQVKHLCTNFTAQDPQNAKLRCRFAKKKNHKTTPVEQHPEDEWWLLEKLCGMKSLGKILKT